MPGNIIIIIIIIAYCEATDKWKICRIENRQMDQQLQPSML